MGPRIEPALIDEQASRGAARQAQWSRKAAELQSQWAGPAFEGNAAPVIVPAGDAPSTAGASQQSAGLER